MISRNGKREPQVQIVSLEELVPHDHLLRKIDAIVDFDFIYGLVEEKYSTETGRPSIDPVTLIKIPIIQYMYGIKSMRQTICKRSSKMHRFSPESAHFFSYSVLPVIDVYAKLKLGQMVH